MIVIEPSLQQRRRGAVDRSTRRHSPVVAEERPDGHPLPDALAGVWANHVDVFWSRHEFTLDFFRLELRGDDPPERGAVVARVAISAILVLQLIEKLEVGFNDYTRWTLHERRDDDEL